MTEKKATPAGSFKLKLFTVVLTTLVMLLIMELALQIIIRVRDGRWLFQRPVSSKVVYTKIVKDKRKFTLKPGFVSQNLGMIIDKQGFRQGPFPIDRENKIIVNAGDSIAFGVSVRNDQTYPYYLARLVREREIPVNVLNSGIPSYNLWQSFERLRREVFTQYDISRIAVVTIQAANDVFLLSYYREKWFPEITWADRRFIIKPSIRDKIATVHYAKQVINKISDRNQDRYNRQERIARLKQKKKQKYLNYEGERKKYDRYEGEEMLEMVRATLHRELPLYREHNIKVILMPIDPFYYQLSNVEKNPVLKKWKTLQYIVKAARDLIFSFNELLIEVSHEYNHVFFLDTRSIMDAQNRDETHADHIHYSSRGNKLAAGALLEFMIQHDMLPQPRK